MKSMARYHNTLRNYSILLFLLVCLMWIPSAQAAPREGSSLYIDPNRIQAVVQKGGDDEPAGVLLKFTIAGNKQKRVIKTYNVRLLDEQYKDLFTYHKKVYLEGLATEQEVLLPVEIDASDLSKYAFVIEMDGGVLLKRFPRERNEMAINIIGQREWLADSQAALRVVCAREKDDKAIPGVPVRIAFAGREKQTERILFVGQTNNDGTLDASFPVPNEAAGQQRLEVKIGSGASAIIIPGDVKVSTGVKVLLSSDKPYYQPNEIMHLRILALHQSNLTPVPSKPLVIEVADAKGNKVFKEEASTTKFGIASADFQLADEVNEGQYTLRAILDDLVTEKTVTVKRYVLPKYKIAVSTEKPYYLPGQEAKGIVSAKYHFGKAIEGGTVKITASAYDVEMNDFATVEGETDKEGNYNYTVKVPDHLVGQPLFKGNTEITLQVAVHDKAGHEEKKWHTFTVARDPIKLDIIPESGTLVPGVENEVYLLASYPDNRPAKVTASVWMNDKRIGSELKTGEMGNTSFLVKPASGEVCRLRVEASDGDGNTTKAQSEFNLGKVAQSLLLRTDRGVYKVGESAKLDIVSTGFGNEPIFVDVVKDRQTVLTKTCEMKDGRGELVLPFDSGLFGSMQVSAYKILQNGEFVRDTKGVFVSRADDLNIDFRPDQSEYRPGDPAKLTFNVTDRRGKGVSTALGIDVVDEAVFAMSENQPGLLQVYFTLEKELLKPAIEVHGFDIETIARKFPPPGEVYPLSKISLAPLAEDPKMDLRVDTRAQFRSEATQELYQLMNLFQQYGIVVASGTQEVEPILWSQGAPVTPNLAQDPWGRPYFVRVTEKADQGEPPCWFSLGPDGQPGTLDDVVCAYNQRGRFVREKGDNLKMQVLSLGKDEGQSFFQSGAVDHLYRFESDYAEKEALRGIGYLGNEVRRGQPRAKRAAPPGVGAMAMPEMPAEALADRAPQARDIPDMRVSAEVDLDNYSVDDNIRADKSNLKAYLNSAGEFPLTELVKKQQPMDKSEAKAGDKEKPEPPEDDRIQVVKNTGEKVTTPVKREDVRIRTWFPETLFSSPQQITDENGRLEIALDSVADSITTWRMTAQANTLAGDIGSATGAMKVFQQFFVDLDLPLSLTKGDEVTIPVAVHNYLKQPQDVEVVLEKGNWFELLEGGQYKQQVHLEAEDVASVKYRLRAKDIGRQSFTVFGYGNNKSDAMTKSIEVIPNGKEMLVAKSDRLGGLVETTVDIPVEAIDGASRLFVKIYPGLFSQVMEGLDSILRMPNGCFEQTSSTSYPNILILDYMRQTKQITPAIEMKAKEYINLGYQRLFNYEVQGGGFSAFGSAPANRVLTAYGLEQFTDMAKVHPVDPALIPRTQQWLAGQQTPDGSWAADDNYVHAEMWEAIQKSRLLPTAYCAHGLVYSGYKGAALDKAMGYLSAHKGEADNAYALSVLARCLVEINPKDDLTIEIIDKLRDLFHEEGNEAWVECPQGTLSFAHGDVANIEVTAAAAIAFMKADRYQDVTKKVLTWLIRKKDPNGVWNSTHATVLSLKTMILALEKSTETAKGSIACTVNGKSVTPIEVNEKNSDVLKLIDLTEFAKEGSNSVKLDLEGEGSLMYQVVGRYYMPWAGGFDPRAEEPMSIYVDYDRTQLAKDDTVLCKVKAVNNQPNTANMVILDVGVPPGFTVLTDELDELVNSRSIEKYTTTGRQVTIYLDKLASKAPKEVAFRMQAKFPLVAKTRKSTVYQYYNPEIVGYASPADIVVTE